MENYKITKEQILETIRTGTDVTERYFKEIIPEAFKKELEIGKWYKTKKNGFEKCLFNFLGEKDKGIIAYGFNAQGTWSSETYWFSYNKTMEFLEATPEEVEVALNAEAKNRGYKEGVRIYDVYLKEKTRVSSDKLDYEMCGYNPDNHGMCLRDSAGAIIFANGKWAQILYQEKTVVPMEKALKIIAKKMKTTPENIEIQY